MNQPDPLRPVRLVGVPVDLHRRSSEHDEALRRELALVEHAADPDGAPARLHRLGRSLADRYGSLTSAQDERLTAAVVAREVTVDLDYALPLEVADAADELERLLEELDAFCRDGDLLTLVTPPELVAYRRWFLDELRDQLRTGRPPRPWSPQAVPHGEEAARSAPPRHRGAESTVVVREELDLALAPTLRDELVQRTEAGATHIVIDLSACPFMDSTGLSLLVTTHLRLAADGGGLRIVGASGQVASVLALSGVEDLLGGSTG